MTFENYPPTAQPPTGGPAGIDPALADQMIKSSRRWAVVTFPSFFLALWALPNAALVSARLARGDLAGAQDAAKTVRILGIIGLVVLVLLFLAGFVSGFSEAYNETTY